MIGLAPTDMSWLAGLSRAGRGVLLEAIDAYLRTDQLQDYRAYPRQLEFHAASLAYRNRLMRAGNQQGKFFLDSTPIPVPGGFCRLDEIEVGDFVIGLDGTPTHVTGVYLQGEQDVFRVTVSDRASVLAGGEHLWMVRKAQGKGKPRPWQIRRTDEMLTKTRWELPDRPIIQGDRAGLPVDPYLLGLLLGDGSLSQASVMITTMDAEMQRYCEEIAPRYGCELTKIAEKSRADTWRFVRAGKRNGLLDALRQVGVSGKTAHDKFIPDAYLWAAPDQRLALLQGLMDTDGSAGKTRNFNRTYSTVSGRLANDILQLLRSLGMQATIFAKRGTYKDERHLSWRVSIRCGGESIFRLSRKKWDEQMGWAEKRRMLIRSIEPAGRGPCRCISVAAPDKMYLIGEGFIPTHNTHPCGAECAMHLTGEYPDSWPGKRFDRPITLWASGKTGEATRDNPQRKLLGQPKQIGTGMIPKRMLSGLYGRAKGVADLYDYYMIRHITGGLSMLKFRYYAQDREAWQGPPVDVVWFDEEPPEDIYQEGLARTIGVRGITLMSFTPLKGYSAVVKLYLRDPDPMNSGRHDTHMTIDDAEHLTDEQKASEIARWPRHEQLARIRGEPALGEGMIFPYDEQDVMVDPFDIPDHWYIIAALDFGGASPNSHPTAAVKLAWDRDNDVIYLVREYRRTGLKPFENWAHLQHWGRNLKWAWPRDGMNEEKGTGVRVIELYRSLGMRALPVYAQYAATNRKVRGSSGLAERMSIVSVERGLIDIAGRIEAEKFKVFKSCPMWLEEMRTYHREDMKIVKIDDDLMDATRYAIMMLRFAHADGPVAAPDETEIDWRLGV